MKNNKKILLSVLGIFILLIAVLGITYSFFSYLGTGEENTVKVGEIEFTASATTMQLTNVYPTTIEETEDVATISVQGYTTYENGIDFTIKAVNVVSQNTNIIPTVVVERETVEGITYTDGGSTTTTYDKNNRLTSDTVLCTGHVEGNVKVGSADELVKLITISVYYDKAEYHISDNTKEVLIQYGMLEEGYEGEVITTTDWNALSKDSEGKEVVAYSFKIEVTAVEGEETYINYNLNGGFGTIDANLTSEGITTIIPTRDYYSFLGWSTDASATEAEYQSGDKYTGDNITLYAVWSSNDKEGPVISASIISSDWMSVTVLIDDESELADNEITIDDVELIVNDITYAASSRETVSELVYSFTFANCLCNVGTLYTFNLKSGSVSDIYGNVNDDYSITKEMGSCSHIGGTSD